MLIRRQKRATQLEGASANHVVASPGHITY